MSPIITALVERSDALCEKLYDPEFSINEEVVNEVVQLYDTANDLLNPDLSSSVAFLVDQLLLRASAKSKTLRKEISVHFSPWWDEQETDGRDLNGFIWLISKR